MDNVKLDDLSLAKAAARLQKLRDSRSTQIIDKAIKGKSLNNGERNCLIQEVFHNHVRPDKPISMSEMKTEILKKIGALHQPTKGKYSGYVLGNVSRDEMFIIYNFIVHGQSPAKPEPDENLGDQDDNDT